MSLSISLNLLRTSLGHFKTSMSNASLLRSFIIPNMLKGFIFDDNDMEPTFLYHYMRGVHVSNYKLHQVFHTCHLPCKLYWNVKNLISHKRFFAFPNCWRGRFCNNVRLNWFYLLLLILPSTIADFCEYNINIIFCLFDYGIITDCIYWRTLVWRNLTSDILVFHGPRK